MPFSRSSSITPRGERRLLQIEPQLPRLVALAILVVIFIFAFTGCQSATPATSLIPAGQIGEASTLTHGTVLKVRDMVVEGNSTALGRKGALVGAAAGSGFGGGDFTSTAIAMTAGLIVGEIIGTRAEKHLTRQRAQELTIRLENGDTLVVTQVIPPGFDPGDDVGVLLRPDGRRVVVH